MKADLVLQLCICLVGLYQAQGKPPPDRTSTSKQTGGVPMSQLRMLSLGLAHLLHGVTENTEQMEQQGEQVSADLNRATKSLESVHKQSVEAGRNHKQVRKDLQILSAQGDRLQRVVRDLQRGLEDLEKEQRAMQYWTNWIYEKVDSLTEPRSEGRTHIDIGSVKDIMDKQAQRLTSLTSMVSARDRLINRRLQHIEQLEKRVSERGLAAQRADVSSDYVR